jgi:hypothetical protein
MRLTPNFNKFFHNLHIFHSGYFISSYAPLHWYQHQTREVYFIQTRYPSIYLSFCWILVAIFSFLTLYTVGRTPWTGDQSVGRPLPTHRTTQTQNKRTQNIHALSGFRTHDPRFRMSEDSSCLRPHGHCDRLGMVYLQWRLSILVYFGLFHFKGNLVHSSPPLNLTLSQLNPIHYFSENRF